MESTKDENGTKNIPQKQFHFSLLVRVLFCLSSSQSAGIPANTHSDTCMGQVMREGLEGKQTEQTMKEGQGKRYQNCSSTSLFWGVSSSFCHPVSQLGSLQMLNQTHAWLKWCETRWRVCRQNKHSNIDPGQKRSAVMKEIFDKNVRGQSSKWPRIEVLRCWTDRYPS